MQQNEADMIRILPKITQQLEALAKEMNTNGQNEREVVIEDTSVTLWLVRSGSLEAKKREEQKASVLTHDSAIVVDGEKFFLARR